MRSFINSVKQINSYIGSLIDRRHGMAQSVAMNSLYSRAHGRRFALCSSSPPAGRAPSRRVRRIPQPPGHGGFHGFPVFWPVERETVYIEREVVREVPAEPTPAPAPPRRRRASPM